MSWTCPTCGANRSCWEPGIYSMPPGGKVRDVVLEAAAQGLVNALAALSETVPGPGGTRPLHPVTYFEASPTKDDQAYKRWTELNEYVSLVKRVLETNQRSENG